MTHMTQNIQISQIMACFKICHTSKSYALETVDRWPKNNSYQSLLTPVIKKLYTDIASNMHFNQNFRRVLSRV